MRLQHLDFCADRSSFINSHTALLCLLTLRACIWYRLHFRCTWSHVFASNELFMGHVIDGNLSLPKNSCFLAFPIYCPIQCFRRLVFCEYVIVELDQNSLDITLSIFGLIVHLLMLGNSAIISKLFSWLYLVICVVRHLTRPLLGRLISHGHEFF